ncbi:MAG TPA: hypothetical protein VGA56_04045 [Opitutaceae bacterium]
MNEQCWLGTSDAPFTMNAENADPARTSGTDGATARPARFEIVRRKDFSDVTFLLEIHDPMMARVVEAGQFVIVK